MTTARPVYTLNNAVIVACDETLEEVPPLCVRSLQHNQDDTLFIHAVWFGWHVHRVIIGYDVIHM